MSRVHSKIYFKDDKFFLEDCGSKFGTLVLVKDELEINDNNKILQIGRTLISTSISNRSISNLLFIKIIWVIIFQIIMKMNI